jgi:hypothetical protein
MSKNSQLKIFADHMEFIGYEFEKLPDDPNGMLGNHDKYGPTVITNSSGTTEFQSCFKIGPKASKKRLQYLELVNELNKKSSISNFVGYDDSLVLVAIYIGPYDKKIFGSFLDAWHTDTYLISEQDGADQFVE